MTFAQTLLVESELPALGPQIEAHFRDRVIHHRIPTADGLELSVLENPGDPALTPLVIIPGRAETDHKYAELLYSLSRENLKVFVIFTRGDGTSDKVVPGSSRTHLKRFADLRNDVRTAFTALKIANFNLMAFSLGGLIALDAVMSGTIAPQKVALLAPYLHPRVHHHPLVLRTVSALMAAIPALAAAYPPGQGEYRRLSFAENHHSHSPLRYQIYHDYYAAHPELTIAGSTWGFLHETLSCQSALRRLNHDFQIPLQCTLAGDDQVVSSRAAAEFFNQHAHDTKAPICITIDGAFHDLLNERDDYRRAALGGALNFLYR